MKTNNDFIVRIRALHANFKKIRHKKRFLIVSFEEDGLQCKRVQYDPIARVTQEIPGFFLKGITEKNIRNNKALRIFLRLLYFPFPYKICVLVPHYWGGSFYYTLALQREHKENPITQEELDIFFSKQLGKVIEENKKEIMKRTGLDDLDSLMVGNNITSMRVDDSCISMRENQQAPIAMIGKTVLFGFTQTFFKRPVFTAIQRSLPRRAKLHSFFQDGFPVPLAMIHHVLKEQTKTKPFIVALVRDKGTNVFVCSPESIRYYDSIPIGYQSIYEILNTKLGIDFDSFLRVIHKVGNNATSAHVTKHIDQILSQEMHRLYNGLQVIKKETKSASIALDPGKLGIYIRTQPTLKRFIIPKESILFFDDNTIIPLHDSLRTTAIIACMLRLPRKHTINHTALKHIRWLIPHAVEKS